ncbi:hypothetical protein JY651_46785 [Pyxidicoccus parkwayensis]|uniref:J domain-containing protein n=1 Tax=Pyxidicoccus parkwayensis TaxID=2813578 RepID=A0ABX7NYM0_9BACT|nr:hypothetical protein [Pyxidicoccus parkwaysis]QSQ22540.1 hypothetical protein JY651_46785 [Pyxidicoccus parkwaysis]
MLSVPFFGTATELRRFTQGTGTSVVLVSTDGTENAFPRELADRISAWSEDVKLASASPEALARAAEGTAVHAGDVFIFADGKLSWRSEPALNLDPQALATQAVSLFISALSQQGYVRLKQRERNEAILTRVKLVAMERLLKNRAKRASRAKAAPPEPERVEDPLALLGLTPGASFEEARAARNALLQQYHPDKVAGLGPKLREVAEAETKRINAAFASLTAPVRSGRGRRE